MSKWAKGKLLQTILALEGIRPGDEVRCRSCKEPHVVTKPITKAVDGHRYIGVAHEVPRLRVEYVVAWRRPT